MKKSLLILPVWILLLLAGCEPAVRPQLGFIYHADGTFDSCVHVDRRPQGVVFAMGVGADSSWCYVLSLEEHLLPFTSVVSSLPGEFSTDSLCGFQNTRLWMKELHGCSPLLDRMAEMGKKWFIPSVGELRLLRSRFDEVYGMLDSIPGAYQVGMNNYLSSTPEPDPAYPQYAIAYDLYGDRFSDCNKADSCRVRFMLRVKRGK